VTIENFRLIVFRAVARHSSFSRAAEELLLTQPAVTQQIKALEEQFGRPLFHRAGGRISLTPGGAALLPFAEQIRMLSEDAIAAVAKGVWPGDQRTKPRGVADDRAVSTAHFHRSFSADESADSYDSSKRQY
jgi:DNA-binding transcriptional LysR family regulator